MQINWCVNRRKVFLYFLYVYFDSERRLNVDIIYFFSFVLIERCMVSMVFLIFSYG